MPAPAAILCNTSDVLGARYALLRCGAAETPPWALEKRNFASHIYPQKSSYRYISVFAGDLPARGHAGGEKLTVAFELMEKRNVTHASGILRGGTQAVSRVFLRRGR
jgi:hypothetical protein